MGNRAGPVKSDSVARFRDAEAPSGASKPVDFCTRLGGRSRPVGAMIRGHLRRPRPRSRAWWVRLVRGLWTLPTNLLGHAAGLLVSGQRPRRVGGPAARGWLYPVRDGLGLDWVVAVTIGHAILYRAGVLDNESLSARLTLAHELAHTRQHDRLGPLYLPLHVLAQSVSALLSIGRPVMFTRVHDRNPLEQPWIAISASQTHRPAATPDLELLLADFGV